jgi:hypothetical protein
MTTEVSSTVSSSDVLWQKVIDEGVENRVEVNQRMLIDKMLARYSSDFAVYRELIQNSDDARATSFQLEITCDMNSAVQNYESTFQDELVHNPRSKTNILGGIGQLFRNHWGTVRASPDSDKNELLRQLSQDASLNSSSTPDIDFHNRVITEIRTVNNGNPFTEADWKRVATIAEGNTNVEAIGQFGVGFFSVFSYSERPMIQSGQYCLAFVWQNGKSLTTFRKELTPNEQSSNTSVILTMRNKYILETKLQSGMNNGIVSETKQIETNDNRTSKTKKNTVTHEIVPIMDLTQLKAYFTKVLSFTKHINELMIKINGIIVFQVNKTTKLVPSARAALASKRLNSNNEHHLLRFNSFVQTEQIFHIAHGPSITLNHVDVEASVMIDKDFHEQIRGVLKKSLPPVVHMQFLFPSSNVSENDR